MVAAIDEIENALSIPIPASERLVLDDSRRLTGPGLLWDRPGAVLDVLVEGFEVAEVARRWQAEARRVLDAVGWGEERTTGRLFDGGANLALSAPMDALYSAVFAAETAWHFCAAELLGETAGDFAAMTEDLRQVIARESNPPLIALMEAARAKGVDVLSDDDALSLGHGVGSQTWPVDALPAVEEVDWSRLHNLPVALITGTNGKTTSVRLAAAVAKAAGRVAGLTSTEFIQVGDEIVERGDFSGPGGARTLLRDRRLEIAFLEVARGGILRRGLPLRRAKAALITNVAEDHLGQYGINTVAELAAAKFAVQRTLADDGVLVLNADDAAVVAEAAHSPAAICWFSLDPDSPQIAAARAQGRPCAWLADDHLIFFDSSRPSQVIAADAIPLAMGGVARYNLRNALGVLCLARALRLDDAAIRAGLSGFRGDPRNNPGRCNEFVVGRARVFVDFAHNPHSIAAVTEALAGLPSRRRLLMVGHGGDRSDEAIRDLTRGAFAFQPDRVIATETPEYLRGRELGEVSAIIRAECLNLGLSEDDVIMADSPADGAAKALTCLQAGDVALLLVHSERARIFDLLAEAANRTA
jgi:UDP-N-acetylmuramyl tripeptide synthase